MDKYYKTQTILRLILGSTTTFCKQSFGPFADSYPGGAVNKHPLGVFGDQNERIIFPAYGCSKTL